MRKLKRYLQFAFVISAMLIAACATTTTPSGQTAVVVPSLPSQTPPPEQKAKLIDPSEIDAHLQNAIDISKAGGDAAAVACWTGAKAWFDGLAIPQNTELNLPPAIGPAGALETLRLKRMHTEAELAAIKALINQDIPQPVKDACAIYAGDVAAIKLKLLDAMGLAALLK